MSDMKVLERNGEERGSGHHAVLDAPLPGGGSGLLAIWGQHANQNRRLSQAGKRKPDKCIYNSILSYIFPRF